MWRAPGGQKMDRKIFFKKKLGYIEMLKCCSIMREKTWAKRKYLIVPSPLPMRAGGRNGNQNGEQNIEILRFKEMPKSRPRACI